MLEKIHNPRDLDSLTEKELQALSAEIRETIISTVAENGGHLASNLGLVEATIALHRSFYFPDDSLIFDVGHQAYAHKLITGRADRFSALRKSDGISGFTNSGESEYDFMTAGHSGSSLSAAIGKAEANRLEGNGRWTVALIGDGSFTNGMIYEALNQLAGTKLKLIVILNDNEMSISKNVGGFSRYLSYIRTSEGYFSFKLVTKKIFNHIPLVGKYLVKASVHLKDFLKRITNSVTFFELLGLEYIGPVDGNNIKKLISVLEEAKSQDAPTVVHIKTKKGLGYPPAAEHPEKYHSISPFDRETGEVKAKKSGETFTERFSAVICREAEKNLAVTAITAAMTDGCGLSAFAEKFPSRFFDVGIAEELAVTMAGGMAKGNLSPTLVLYSTFVQRVFDQLWQDVSLQKEKLTLILSHAGIVAGEGVTHQGIYDVALLSRLPEVTIYSPDTLDSFESVYSSSVSSGERCLTVIRYPKSTEADYGEYGGKFTALSDGVKLISFGGGEDFVLLITYGKIAEEAVRAAREAAKLTGIAHKVAVVSKIVPTPSDPALIELTNRSLHTEFVEEVISSGSVGESYSALPDVQKKIGFSSIREGFLKAGTRRELLLHTRLDSESIKDKLVSAVSAGNGAGK